MSPDIVRDVLLAKTARDIAEDRSRPDLSLTEGAIIGVTLLVVILLMVELIQVRHQHRIENGEINLTAKVR